MTHGFNLLSPAACETSQLADSKSITEIWAAILALSWGCYSRNVVIAEMNFSQCEILSSKRRSKVGEGDRRGVKVHGGTYR